MVGVRGGREVSRPRRGEVAGRRQGGAPVGSAAACTHARAWSVLEEEEGKKEKEEGKKKKKKEKREKEKKRKRKREKGKGKEEKKGKFWRKF